ncbi:hypothetical protein ABZ642_44245 [Streptomyces sp. NPDC007157]|uniref:hypothetical protein n=1 Tax=Streptomyces sp. NPDC007157 TaxID=3154681 RepID=UPI003404B2ED
MPDPAGQGDGGAECGPVERAGGDGDESAVVNGLRSWGWWVAAGARFRLSAGPGVRISTAGLEPSDAVRPASDFAAVLGESEATCGG